MSEKLTLPLAMTDCSGTPPDMDSTLEPLLALFAIFFPLGMTYVILSLQMRNQRGKNCDDCNQEET